MSVRPSPHIGQPVRTSGPSLSTARLVVVLAHGRGGSPEDMLNLGAHLGIVDIAYVAPAAAGRSWWPQSFLAPLEENEPWLGSALSAFNDTVDGIIGQGIPAERIVVAGFSQGACLALEHAARTARNYLTVIGLSGGLLGTRDEGGPPTDELYGYARKGFDYPGRLDGVTVFLGCHQHDPHIPLFRVHETARVFQAMGGDVTTQIYPGQGHGIVEQEISFLRGQLNG
ncbi:MAG: phospholipase [Pseudomonadota bacterium]